MLRTDGCASPSTKPDRLSTRFFLAPPPWSGSHQVELTEHQLCSLRPLPSAHSQPPSRHPPCSSTSITDQATVVAGNLFNLAGICQVCPRCIRVYDGLTPIQVGWARSGLLGVWLRMGGRSSGCSTGACSMPACADV